MKVFKDYLILTYYYFNASSLVKYFQERLLLVVLSP